MKTIHQSQRMWEVPIRLLVLAAMLGGCLWLAWMVPYTHDDWDWGLPMGLEWWRTGAMNNRYVGTFFVVVMTRWPVVKTLVMGGTMFALPLLAAAVAAPGKAKGNWFALSLFGGGLLMTMPTVTWRQTYGWVSAFANFVVLGVWMLLLILLARAGTAEGYRGWKIPVLLLLLGLTGQLFAENVSAMTAAAALGLAVWSLFKKRGRTSAFSLLVGALIGLALMFYNPIYSDLAASGTALNGIRHLTFSLDEGVWNILIVMLRRYVEIILPTLFEDYPAIWAALCVGALYQAFQRHRKLWPLWVLLGLFCAGGIWSSWLTVEELRLDSGWVHPYPLLRAAIPTAVVVLLVLLMVTAMDWRAWLPCLALLSGALALLVPFAALEENGARCCFPSAVLLLVLALALLADFPWGALGTIGAGLFITAALVFHLQVFQVIEGCYSLREQLMREAVEQDESAVILPTEAWKYFYTWGHNPQGEERAVSYRAFYGLPEDMELIFLPPGSYDEWPEVTEEMFENATVWN